MRPRYLLAAGNGQPELVGRICSLAGLELVFSNERLAAFTNLRCRSLAVRKRGCILGTLFHRYGPARPIESLNGSDAASIQKSNGQALLGHFWGGYVAAIAEGDKVTVLRDPSAALPCYFTHGNGFIAFSSDAELLIRAGFETAEIDWQELARHFFRAGVPSPPTSLCGISELLPGFAIRFPGDLNQIPCWSPWDHVHEHADTTQSAAERLERTVKHCVRAWTTGQDRLLVSVSGGLDSSIVAAALAEAQADLTCLTMFGEDPGGDERAFARALCTHLGIPLIERPYRLADIDISEPLGAHLPRTSDRTQALAYERAHLEAAREIAATAFVTGNGGDSLFGYSQSASAIADRFLRQGPREALQTLGDVSRQTGCSLTAAAASALRIARGQRSYRCRPNGLFLHPGILAQMDPRLEHPWLDAPADALPGKAAHVASILRVLQSLEPGRAEHLPVLNPLMSQPVIEACLGIPSWEWRAGGRDRSVARRAFAADLPQMIINRRIKGSPSHFAAQILERFLVPIRERLLDGHLARQAIVDRNALEVVLQDNLRVSDEQRVRILEFVAAEAWIDSWLSKWRLPEVPQKIAG